MSARLRLADLLGGLSIVADLGFGLPPETAMRGCVIGTALARKLELPEQDVVDTFYATLLLHVGCTALAHETAVAFGDDLTVNSAVAKTNFADPRDLFRTMIPEATRGMPPIARARAAAFIVTRGKAFGKQFDTGSCEVARETARRIGLGVGVQRVLYEAHEWWNGGGAPRGLEGEEIALPARIARLAADAALFSDLGGRELAAHALQLRSRGMLDPALVDAFLANDTELLDDATAHDPRARILEIEPEPVIQKEGAELRDVARAFGDIADLKTPFTHGHSQRSRDARVRSRGPAPARHCDALPARASRAPARSRPRRHLERRLGEAWTADRSRVGAGADAPVPLRTHPRHLTRARVGRPDRRHAPRAPGWLGLPPRLPRPRHPCRVPHPRSRGRLPGDDPAAAAPRSADVGPAQEELVTASRAGQLDPDAVAAVLEAAGRRGPSLRRDLRPAGLSEREVEVLRLVAEGCSNRELARRLSISPRTADHHVQHIYVKIGVSSRAAAALFALEHDLLSAVGS